MRSLEGNMQKVEYPKWLYHRTEKPVIVQDPDEAEALGAGWNETPAAFDEPEPETNPEMEQEPERKLEVPKPKKPSRPKA